MRRTVSVLIDDSQRNTNLRVRVQLIFLFIALSPIACICNTMFLEILLYVSSSYCTRLNLNNSSVLPILKVQTD